MRVFSRFVELSGLRAEFPVLRAAGVSERRHRRAAARARRAGRRRGARARGCATDARTAHFERRAELERASCAPLYAAALGCDSDGPRADDVARAKGIAQVIGGLELGRGDEIVTSDEEHPGCWARWSRRASCSGVSIGECRSPRSANAVGPRTRLVACSHVGWMSGSLAPAELAEVEVPVLLDGAQGVGAVPVDVARARLRRLRGRRAEVAVRPRRDRDAVREPGAARAAAGRRGAATRTSRTRTTGLDAGCTRTRRRFDALSLSAETRRLRAGVDRRCWTSAGWARCTSARGRSPRGWRSCWPSAGIGVAPRGASTLVSFASADPEAERARLAAGGVVAAQHPRPALAARVGRSMERRGRPRAADRDC